MRYALYTIDSEKWGFYVHSLLQFLKISSVCGINNLETLFGKDGSDDDNDNDNDNNDISSTQ